MLNISPVVFDKDNHTYHYDGVKLSGVTSLLRRQMFESMYDGVPEAVLTRKASKGTEVHEAVENFDNIGINNVESYMDGYMSFLNGYSFTHVASEYLVSDLQHVASSIDKVYTDKDGNYILVDIKTTSQLHVDYVRWQLSIYKYLFELQNEAIKAEKIGVLWLNKNKWVYRELIPFSSREVKDLIETDARFEKYVPELEKNTGLLIAEKEQKEIALVLKSLKELKAKETELRKRMLELMKSNGCKSFSCDLFSMTYVYPSQKQSVDTGKLKDKYPDIYEEMLKTSNVGESIKITIK